MHTQTLNVNALDPNLGFYPYVTVSKVSIYTSTAERKLNSRRWSDLQTVKDYTPR